MLEIVLFPLLLLISTSAQAEICRIQCPVTSDNVRYYFEADNFQWTDPSDVQHMLIGFGGTFVIATILEHHWDMKPWQAALIGAVTMGIIGTTKEVMFDTYTSRTDIQTYWGGALTGGLTFTLLKF